MDETFVKNLINSDDFHYYSLLYDDEPDMGGNRMQYIYNGKIYYGIGKQNGERKGRTIMAGHSKSVNPQNVTGLQICRKLLQRLVTDAIIF